MTTSQGDTLRDLFEQFQMDWFLKAFPSEPEVLMTRFAAVAEAYESKLATVNVPELVPKTVHVQALAQMAEDNPIRAQAFLQLFASSVSKEMLAMAWLLQHDAQIAKIDFQFEQRESFDLRIEVQLGRRGATVNFRSDRVFDIAVLRHFGTLQANDKPMISGLYPLKVARGNRS